MFDTHHHHSTKHVPYEKKVTVTVNRAPTDKSVELLNEFQEKAKDNIIDTILIENNVINGAVIFFSNDVLHDKIDWALKFKLNNTEYKLKGQINRVDVPLIGTSDPKTKQHVLANFLLPKFVEEISKHIALQAGLQLTQLKPV